MFVDPDNYLSNWELRNAIFQHKTYQRKLVIELDKLQHENNKLKHRLKLFSNELNKLKKLK